MPEGHTIHRLARDHTRDFVGQKLQLKSPQGRFELKQRSEGAPFNSSARGAGSFFERHGVRTGGPSRGSRSR